MSESYPGNNAGPPLATITIPTDGDDVDAASVDPAFQQIADNDAYAISYYPDTHAGGTYNGTAQINLSNIFQFNGPVIIESEMVVNGTGWVALRSTTTPSYIANGSVLNVGDPAGMDGNGSIVVRSGSQIGVVSGAQINLNSGSEVIANIALDSRPVPLVATLTTSFDCSTTNTFFVSNTMSGVAAWTFNVVNAADGYRGRIYFSTTNISGGWSFTFGLSGASVIKYASASLTGANSYYLDFSVVVSSGTTFLLYTIFST